MVEDPLVALLQSIGDPSATGSTPTPAGPASTPAPDILQLLASTQSAPAAAPSLPQADTSMATPLGLLQFASTVTAPRRYGQSTTHSVLNAANAGVTTAMAAKKQMEDRAIEQEVNRRKLAVTDEQLKNTRLSGVKTTQDILESEKKLPLELRRAEQLLNNATTDGELKTLEVKLARIKEKYADEEARAALEERNARTATQKADAAMRNEHARLYRTQANEYLEAIKLRRAGAGANARNFDVKEGLPGEPTMVVDKTTGQTYQAPMNTAAAYEHAKRQVAAERAIGRITDTKSEKSRIIELTHQFERGNIPAQGTAPTGSAPGSAPGSQPVSSATGPTSAGEKTVIDASKADPGKVKTWQGRFFVNGREIDKNEADRLVGKATSAPATRTSTTTPAPNDDSKMQTMYDRETEEISRGKRREYSANVRAWMEAQPNLFGGAGEGSIQDEQQRQLRRGREAARGY